MRKNNWKFILYILIIVILFFSLISLKKYSFEIKKEGDFLLNNPITFKIYSKYYGKNKALGPININIYNKHNNDEKMSSTIIPYQQNCYEFIFIPSVPGEYYFNISYQPANDKDVIAINDNFSIK